MKQYATISFSADDLTGLENNEGFSITREEAEKCLENIEDRIREAMFNAAWEVIDDSGLYLGKYKEEE